MDTRNGDTIMVKSKQFNIFQETIKSVTEENGDLYITGIANTGNRDLVGDIVTDTALEEIAAQAVNRNLHFNHNGNYDDTLTELTESIIGVITEAKVVPEGVEIKSKILPKHVEVIRYFLENEVKFGLSISGKAHYADNSFEEIESWDLTEISLVPIPCDQGTMGTVRISKSFNDFITYTLEDEKMAEEDVVYITQEQAEELINAAFNEKEEELLEQVRGELKDEYETKINGLVEQVEALTTQVQALTEGNEGEGEGEGAGQEGKPAKSGDKEDEEKSPEEEEEEEKRIDSLVEKKTEELLKQIFGKHSPNFNYKNEDKKQIPEQKSFTPREIAEIITGGK